jgi:hypothetical protein
MRAQRRAGGGRTTIERIQLLPKSQQRFVMQMLDTVLQQADR